VETVLRMLILRHYFNWSFLETEQLVKDSFSLRLFAPIYFEKLLHFTALSRYKRLIAEATLKQINHKIVKLAHDKKITAGRQLRVDTTVVETNIHYPTDSSLLANGICQLARLVNKVKQASIATGELVRDFRRSAQRQVLNIVKFASSTSQTAQQSFEKCYRHLIDITQRVVNTARTLKRTVVNRARRLGIESSVVARHVKQQWDHYLPLIDQVIFQNQRRILGANLLLTTTKLLGYLNPIVRSFAKGNAVSPMNLDNW
jgi:IS5 family transposase